MYDTLHFKFELYSKLYTQEQLSVKLHSSVIGSISYCVADFVG